MANLVEDIFLPLLIGIIILALVMTGGLFIYDVVLENNNCYRISEEYTFVGFENEKAVCTYRDTNIFLYCDFTEVACPDE